MKAYLDTNILIDYLWATHFSEKSTKKSDGYFLLNKGESGEFEISYHFIILSKSTNTLPITISNKIL